MKAMVPVAALMVVLMPTMQASAKTLYVDGLNGSDSVSYANNSQSNPWRTLGRATWGAASPTAASTSEAARAGDLVLVSGGPFTAPASGERYVPAFNPANSGTSANPITFRAVGQVELRTSGGTGPVMGVYRRDFIRWEGAFTIDETYVPVHSDTGPIVIWESTGAVIDGCDVQGRPITYVDNHNGVRFERATNSVLRNCRIRGIVGTPSDLMHHNKAGVMLYYSNGIIIENNEILDSGAGIFPKGGNNYDITIRFNLIRGARKGVRISYSAPSNGQNRIYQNIIANGADSDHIGIDVAEGAYNWTIANNTIVSVNNGIYLTPSVGGGIRIANNIIANTSTAVNAWESQVAVPGPGRNLYQSAAQWAWSSRVFSTLTSWLAIAPGDTGSISVNAGFESGSAGDYRLVASSPARGLGLDLLDLDFDGSTSDAVNAGAYVVGNETIGRNLGPRPAAPSALRAE